MEIIINQLYIAQEKGAGTKLIHSIITMRSARRTSLQERSRLAQRLATAGLEDPSGAMSVEIQMDLEGLESRLKTLTDRLRANEELLAKDGAVGLRKLKELGKSKFVEAMVNAMACKVRICAGLRNRMFEGRRLVDNHRSQTLGMHMT